MVLQALPLLDDNGFLTEIRVTNPGRGYKLNKPEVAQKECIIDAFTLLNVGRNYKTPPAVYVNGDSTIAESVINERGQVISVRIKNRELTFDRYPEILILGGGGYGAKAFHHSPVLIQSQELQLVLPRLELAVTLIVRRRYRLWLTNKFDKQVLDSKLLGHLVVQSLDSRNLLLLQKLK